MNSSVVKKVRPRRLGSPNSLSSSQASSDDIPLPKILHLYFDGDATKIFADKREAHQIVQGAFSNFTTGKPRFDGRIQKVNLHPNKKSLFLWLDDVPDVDLGESWIPFAKTIVQNGHVVQLADKEVARLVKNDAHVCQSSEQFGQSFAEQSLQVVANLPAVVREAPQGPKRNAEAAGLVRILKGANAYAVERAQNKAGKTISNILDELDEAEVGDLDEAYADEEEMSEICNK